MRIAFLSQRAHPSVGGIENYQRQVAAALAARHEVTVYAQRIDHGPIGRQHGVVRGLPTFPPLREDGVTTRPLRLGAGARAALAPLLVNSTPGLGRFAYGRGRRVTAAWYAAVAARSSAYADIVRDADILHVWGGDYLASAGVRAARHGGRPVVVTPFAHGGQWGDDPGSAAAYRRADAVVGLLEHDAQLYRDLGVAAEQVHVCGVCSEGVPPGGGAALRAQHGITGPVVLFLGVRRAHKGFDRLLASATAIAVERPDVTLVFAGPGEPIDARDSPLRVIDVGRVAEPERAGWLDAADLFCLPSLGEIFPVSILEAFSVGTPALTSDIPPLDELMRASGGGVPGPVDSPALARSIVRLLADPEHLAALGEAGRTFWRRAHTPAAVADWYETLYSDLIGKG